MDLPVSSPAQTGGEQKRWKSAPYELRWFCIIGSLVPQVLIRIARAEAVATRHSSILICVLRTDEDLGFHDNAINNLEADKDSLVTFGPWRAAPSVKDLLDCVKMDIERRGYRVSIEPHVTGRLFLSRSYNFFYKLTFTWW